ncbi:MAG: PKD domain-containing protein [Gemmatimonadaceae bacterium]
MRLRSPLVALAIVALYGCTGTDSPTNAPAPAAIARDVTGNADPVIVAAGDIACGTGTAAGTPCRQAAVANVIGSIHPDAVLPLGDNQYENGTLAEFNSFYGPTWGAYKSITRPAVGNHEYQTANASGYFDYFNGVGVQSGPAGDRGKGYYSYDLGAWHLIALNSNCGSVGGCGAGSAQETWLRADLAAHPAACTLAYWHHPRFSSGVHGNDASTQALWQALYNAKADVVLAGHDHNYERFAPQTATGTLDNANGVRSFVVGTGGKEQRAMGTTVANSQLRSNTSFGVLKLTLHPTSMDWQFVPVPGDPLNDAGSAACVVAATNQPPTASITSPANPSSAVQGSAVSFAGTGNDPESGALAGSSLVWTSDRDGAIGTGTSFTKSNLSVGTHVITLTVTDPQGATGSTSTTLTITPASTNQPPVARFTWTCTGQAYPNQCAFDASTSSDDAGIVAYVWNWGNGKVETRSFATARNTWAAPGVYTVTLTVRDAAGLTNSQSQQVTVGAPPANQSPSATISSPANGASAVQGTSVSFAGTGSDPEDGVLSGSSLVWTSSLDGTIGTGTSFSRSNLSVGTHTITLTATDAQGATGTASVSITITAAPPVNQPPVARFTFTCAGQSYPHQCFFDASTSTDDAGITGYTWNWGNGRIENKVGNTARNTWAAAGTYTVTLTVKDAGGLTSSTSAQVNVP